MRVTSGGVLVHNGRILLGHRRADRNYYPGAWDIFGGHCEHGETPEQALVRELMQELGVTPQRFERIGIFEEPFPQRYGPAQHHLFLVQGWMGQPTNLRCEEHDAIGWFTRAELPGLKLASPRYVELLDGLL
jgi:8-oxo-dGTP diphosphatase